MAENNFDNTKKQDVDSTYSTEYLKWKSWGGDQFANLSASDRAYYCAEIERSGRNYPARSRVLEVGFGNGGFLKFCASMQWDVTGTEVNPELITIARAAGYDVMGAEKIREFSSGMFDLVVAFDVLEHIPKDELTPFLSEIRRILKQDGRFIARFPNGDSPFGLVYQNGDITHITSIGNIMIRHVFATADLEPIFIGSHAVPLKGLRVREYFRRIVVLTIRSLIDRVVNFLFYPGLRITFCSENMVVIGKTKRKV